MAPKRQLKKLKSDSTFTEFTNFWVTFDDIIEGTSKSWTDKFMLLREYLDENLQAILDAKTVTTEDIAGPTEAQFFDYYWECKAEIYRRQPNCAYTKTETDIAKEFF